MQKQIPARWELLSDPEVATAIERAARKAARLFPLVSLEDATADAQIYIATHPQVAERHRGNVSQLMQAIYVKGLRPRAVKDSDRAAITISLSTPGEDEDHLRPD